MGIQNRSRLFLSQPALCDTFLQGRARRGAQWGCRARGEHPSHVVWAWGQEVVQDRTDLRNTMKTHLSPRQTAFVPVAQLPLNPLPSWKKERLNTQHCAFQDSNFHTHKNACSSHCCLGMCVLLFSAWGNSTDPRSRWKTH